MLRHKRLAVLLLLAVACLALPSTGAVGRSGEHSTARPARLAYPDAPRLDYSPRLVHQLYNNCAFASAEMLIDKWTEGRRRAPQQTLRRVTGIAPVDGGPTLAQLRRAVARTSGVDMRWSPHGGDALTWHELLARLEDGGGALVNVWPAKLPRHYRRWLPALVAGHSVYVERYQHSRNRVWLMDPLGRGTGFRGEWIDADDLHAAMWHTGQFVWAAATPPPTPRPPDLADFELGAPELPEVVFSEDSIAVALSYTTRRLEATLPELRIAGRWERVPDVLSSEEPAAAAEPAAATGSEPDAALPIEEAALVPDAAPRVPTAVEPIDAFATSLTDAPDATLTLPPAVEATPVPFVALSETLVADDGALLTELVTPHVPGDYLLELELRDAGGQPLEGDVARLGPVTVRVRGPLAGQLKVRGVQPESARLGDVLSLQIKTTNLGIVPWDETTHPVAMAVSWDGDASTTLVPMGARPGETRTVRLLFLVDTELGRRTLRLTLVDGAGTPLADSAPVELVLDVNPRDARLAERH